MVCEDLPVDLDTWRNNLFHIKFLKTYFLPLPFKWCVRIALLTLILGGTTRLLATLPKDLEIGSMEVTINVTGTITESNVNIILSSFLVNDHFDQGRTKFSLVLIGGVLIEMGHPFVMIVATKVIAIKIFKDLQNCVRPH